MRMFPCQHCGHLCEGKSAHVLCSDCRDKTEVPARTRDGVVYREPAMQERRPELVR